MILEIFICIRSVVVEVTMAHVVQMTSLVTSGVEIVTKTPTAQAQLNVELTIVKLCFR